MYSSAIKAIRDGKIRAVVLDSGEAQRMGPICNPRITGSVTKGYVPVVHLRSTDLPKCALRDAGFSEMTLAVSPHPGANLVERYYQDPAIHGIKVRTYREDLIRGNLGTLMQLFKSGLFNFDEIEHVAFLFADTVLNFELLPILAAQIDNEADLTIAGYAIPSWVDEEWDLRSFGVAVLEGMPSRPSDMPFASFQEKMNDFLQQSRGKALTLTRFREKIEDPTRYMMTAESNIIYAGVAFLSVKLIKALRDVISTNFNDMGFGLLPALDPGRHNEFSGALSPDFLRRLEKREFKSQCYVLPEFNTEGKKVFYHDLASPASLLKMQRLVLSGAVDIGAATPGNEYWKPLDPTGYVGISNPPILNTEITTSTHYPGAFGPFLGAHGDYRNSSFDPLSVALDYTYCESSKISGSLIFGGTGKGRDQQVLIENMSLDGCIVMGPVILKRTGAYHRFGKEPHLKHVIVHRNPFAPNDPESWAFTPMDIAFGKIPPFRLP